MLATTYTNDNGQLVSDYREEKQGEYLEFITQRMFLPKKAELHHNDYSTFNDETLLDLRRHYETMPERYSGKLYHIYNEITRRKL